MTCKQLTILSTRLTEFLIQGWNVSGYSQVLTKSVCESRWDLTPPTVGVNISSMFQSSKTLARIIPMIVMIFLKGWDAIGCTDSGWQLALVILSIKGQRDELYGNHMLEILECCLITFDLFGHRVSLLDGDFDWCRKYFYAIGLVFEPMGSHI